MIIELTITFLAGATFAGLISYVGIKMIFRSKVPEMCHEECERIIKLERENKQKDKKLKVAIKCGCDALNDRNEALIMLSNKLSDDIRKP